MSKEPRQNKGRWLVDCKLVEGPSNFIAGCSKAALLFGSLVILDVVCYLLFFNAIYINIDAKC